MEDTDVEAEFEKNKRASYDVHVQLPKFKIESSHPVLERVLRELGMKDMFSMRADFTDMVHPSRVQGVLHVNSVSHNFLWNCKFLLKECFSLSSSPGDPESNDRS